ncbi:nucleotidyltransferase substrate binding protein [Parabacteroides sp.]
MEQQDIRWKQRFRNFDKAFHRLDEAMRILPLDPDNFLLQAGIIQIYEFTFELAWKTLKDYLDSEGFTTPSPKATLRQAFQSGYIQDGDLWLKALNDRNLTSHTYDDVIAMEVVRDIQGHYFYLLKDLHEWLRTRQ